MTRSILPKIFSFFFIATLSLLNVKNVFASSGSLDNVSDQISNIRMNQAAAHSVSFTLPLDSAGVRTSDFILIDLPYFSNVTAPTVLSGTYGGNPIFKVAGQVAEVTNITMTPGNQLIIGGITAINPSYQAGYNVRITIAEDEAGSIIKNVGNTAATNSNGTINISASIVTPEASLAISGLTSQNLFVTFSEYGAVTGTTLSAPNGFFSHVFTGLIPGDHQITLYGVDHYNLGTSSIILNIYTPAYEETAISNLLLSPTIKIDNSSYLLGTPIIASGTAVPNGNITVLTESPLRSYNTTADLNGDWGYSVPTDDYIVGDYHIHAIAQTNGGLTSLNSPSIGFSMITSLTATPSGTACGDITRGDLNCDNIIDLTDFSIMMYYWGTNDKTADMNGDGIVNLTDFSIMMYYWGT